MDGLVTALNWISIGVALVGAGVCLWYAWRCKSDDRPFYAIAGFLQLYTAMIYVLALAGDLYVVRAGILGRLSQIMYAGLLTAWAIAHSRRCK